MKHFIQFWIFIFITSLPGPVSSQVGIGTTTPDNSAILDLQSARLGLLLPRMNTLQQKNILDPASGLVIFNTDSNDIYFFAGDCWLAVRDIFDTIQPWVCGDSLIDHRDDQVYGTVQIGTQCWMAENMNLGTMISNTQAMAGNGMVEKYCYLNQPDSCVKYGGLYQWDEAMQYSMQPGAQGICLPGWHLPTDEEWCTLTTYIDASVNCTITNWSGTDVGTKMKSTSGWFSGGNGSNTSGFTALPGGYNNYLGTCFHVRERSYFLSCTEIDDMYVWHRLLFYNSNTIGRFNAYKLNAYPVRCILD